MMKKFDEFTNRETSLKTEKDSLKNQNKRKTSALKQKEYALKIDKIKKQMSQYVAGASSYE